VTEKLFLTSRPGIIGEVKITCSGVARVKEMKLGIYSLNLAKAEGMKLAADFREFTVAPVANPEPYYFGLF